MDFFNHFLYYPNTVLIFSIYCIKKAYHIIFRINPIRNKHSERNSRCAPAINPTEYSYPSFKQKNKHFRPL